MAGLFHRRWLVLFLAAGAGLACWRLAPVTGVERLAFSTVMRGYANPPVFLSGQGTHDEPWAVRTLTVREKIDARKAPVVVSIGDDPGGVFQSSPPSPVDLAVVLANLQRLGAKQAAIAAVLAWEKPDPVALKGLEMVLGNFQLVIHAAPLSRGTARQPMPPAMRRASLSTEVIDGDLAKLPIVNRVAVPDVIFGGEGALAGFTSLDDADSGTGALPLLARWEEDDRVVLAFPLLAVLARYDLPVSGIRVKLGEFLQLGPAGPVVPIDRFGRMALPAKPVASRADVSAEALIDGTPEIFPDAPGLIVLRDDQSAAPRATRKFSANLASAIASIGSDAGLGPACVYRRLTAAWEASLMMVVVALLTLIAGWSRFRRQLGCGILAALCIAAQWLAVGLAQLWLPGVPLLGAVVAGGLVMLLLGEAPPLADVVAPPVPRVPAPRAVPARKRTFQSVTMRKDVVRYYPVTDPVPTRMEEPAEVPEPDAPVEEIVVVESAAVPEDAPAGDSPAPAMISNKPTAGKPAPKAKAARKPRSHKSTKKPPSPSKPPPPAS